MAYGVDMRKLAQLYQEAVVGIIENLTGLNVPKVDVTVKSLEVK